MKHYFRQIKNRIKYSEAQNLHNIKNIATIKELSAFVILLQKKKTNTEKWNNLITISLGVIVQKI